MKLHSKIVTGLVMGLIATTGLAQDEQDVKVRAAVVENCKIQSAEDINFGLLDPSLATDATASGSVSFACTKDVDYAVAASDGAHFDNDSSSRRMKGAGLDYLPYALAQDSFAGVGQGFSQAISVAPEARLACADDKDLPADDYRDTLVVTITP
jgi:spore coat protein U-like protein